MAAGRLARLQTRMLQGWQPMSRARGGCSRAVPRSGWRPSPGPRATAGIVCVAWRRRACSCCAARPVAKPHVALCPPQVVRRPANVQEVMTKEDQPAKQEVRSALVAPELGRGVDTAAPHRWSVTIQDGYGAHRRGGGSHWSGPCPASYGKAWNIKTSQCGGALCRRVPKYMGVDGLRQVRGLPSVSAEALHRAGRQRACPRLTRQEPGARCILLPILPEEREECRGQHAIAIVLAFAVPDPQDQARAVHVRDLQRAPCGHPSPRRIERREDGAVLQVARDGQEGGDRGWAAEDGPRGGAPGRGDRLPHRWASQRHTREAAQGTHGLHDGGPGNLCLLDQKELRGADLLRAERLRGGPTMLGAIGDTAQRRASGMRRGAAALQSFEQALTQRGHARASGLHARTPAGQKVPGAACSPRRSRRSHCGPERGEMARRAQRCHGLKLWGA